MDEDRTSMEACVELCVSFCEATHPASGARELESLVASTCSEAHFPFCKRIYAGSYFCENYFLVLPDSFHDALRELCTQHEMGATLVVPIFGQGFLEAGEARVFDLLRRYGQLYDEVVVNDVGMFFAIAEWLQAQAQAGPERATRISLGRLFSKELRDARYPDAFEKTSRPALSGEAAACLEGALVCNPLAAPLVEVDPGAETVDVSALLEDIAEQVPAAERAQVAMHLPLCYATTGRICNAASVGAPITEKFRMGQACELQCLDFKQENITGEGVRYLRHGRTYYYSNPDCQIAGTDSWRIVYAACNDTMR